MNPHQDNLALKVDPISPEIATMLKNRNQRTVPTELKRKILIVAAESINTENIVVIKHPGTTVTNQTRNIFFAVAASIVVIFSLYITYNTFNNATTSISKSNNDTIAFAWENPVESENLFVLRERIELLNSSYSQSTME